MKRIMAMVFVGVFLLSGIASAGSIYLMDLDGSNKELIYTSQYGNYIALADWSPDGEQLLFRDGPYNGYDLWTFDLTGYTTSNITNDSAHNGGNSGIGGSWSPDGSEIVYSRRSGPNSSSYSVEVWKMNADGTNKVQLTSGTGSGYSGENDNPEWSPDGSRIVYSSGELGVNGYHDIWTMDPDGSNKTRITTDPLWENVSTWSSDGSQIAYTKDANIWKMDADGGNQTQLNSGGNVHDWSSLDQLVYTYLSDIFIMDSDGTNILNLTNSSESEYSALFSPDGNKIAFVQYDNASPPGAPVPEPTTMLLLGTGLIGLAGARRKMKS